MELNQFIKEYTESVGITANDIFSYASADTVYIDIYDLPKAIEMESKFGWDGLLAFMELVHECEPLKELHTDKYREAKAYLTGYQLFGTSGTIEPHFTNLKELK